MWSLLFLLGGCGLRRGCCCCCRLSLLSNLSRPFYFGWHLYDGTTCLFNLLPCWSWERCCLDSQWELQLPIAQYLQNHTTTIVSSKTEGCESIGQQVLRLFETAQGVNRLVRTAYLDFANVTQSGCMLSLLRKYSLQELWFFEQVTAPAPGILLRLILIPSLFCIQPSFLRKMVWWNCYVVA